jgi:myo-inositol-1(or 4)-monophosphatase
MPQALEELMDVARRAALAGGAIVGSAAVEASDIETKGAGDYVTEVDRASERAIADLLAAATPGIPMIGEELGGAQGERYWVVDPLDGTTNFVHRFPVVGVSVALIEDGEPVAGCVHAPFLGRTWTGARGLGAHADDGAALRISSRPPGTAVVGTGFPFRRKELIPRHLAALESALERFEDLRRPGAAALDLSWVGLGRRGRRPPDRGGWWGRHRLGGRRPVARRRHPRGPTGRPRDPPGDRAERASCHLTVPSRAPLDPTLDLRLPLWHVRIKAAGRRPP